MNISSRALFIAIAIVSTFIAVASQMAHEVASILDLPDRSPLMPYLLAAIFVLCVIGAVIDRPSHRRSHDSS